MRFGILGPLQVSTDAGLVHLGSKKVRELLAILLLQRGDVVPLERLIDQMWEESPPRSAVENLRTYVYQLRRYLVGERQVLVSEPGGYRLDAGPDELDAASFTRLLDEGASARRMGNNEEAAEKLSKALALWRGEVMPGLDFSQRIQAKIVALVEARWEARLSLAEIRLEMGQAAGLVAPLREFIGERDLDERLWYLLIAALFHSGRSGEALAAYDAARRTFVRELGIEPGPRLQQLQARILQGDAVHAHPCLCERRDRRMPVLVVTGEFLRELRSSLAAVKSDDEDLAKKPMAEAYQRRSSVEPMVVDPDRWSSLVTRGRVLGVVDGSELASMRLPQDARFVLIAPDGAWRPTLAEGRASAGWAV